MATTSSTWNFDSESPLIGVGIDVEAADRFTAALPLDVKFGMVFGTAEARRIAGVVESSNEACAAFGAKEAVFKAIGVAFDPTDVVLQGGAMPGFRGVKMPLEITAERGVTSALAWVGHDLGEVTVVVWLFGHGGAR